MTRVIQSEVRRPLISLERRWISLSDSSFARAEQTVRSVKRVRFATVRNVSTILRQSHFVFRVPFLGSVNPSPLGDGMR